MKQFFAKVLNFLKTRWLLVVAVLLGVFLALGGYKKIKLFLQNLKYGRGGASEPNVIATRIYANFHGSILGFQPGWFNQNENEVIKIINGLPDQKAFNEVARAYSADHKKDLREELPVQLGSKYNELKFN